MKNVKTNKPERRILSIILDATNVQQQSIFDEEHVGDYGAIQLETIAPGKDVNYMWDGERYYIEDYKKNLITISKPMK